MGAQFERKTVAESSTPQEINLNFIQAKRRIQFKLINRANDRKRFSSILPDFPHGKIPTCFLLDTLREQAQLGLRFK